MSHPRKLALLTAWTLLLACTIEGSVGDDGQRGGGGGSGTDASETASAETEAQTSDTSGVQSAGGSGVGTGGATETGSSGDPAPRDTEPSDTMPPSDVPPECHPLPDEQACARCRKVNCCGALTECLAHDTCLCWWECRHIGGSVEECGAQCESGGQLFAELATCVELSCDCLL